MCDGEWLPYGSTKSSNHKLGKWWYYDINS